MERGVEYLGAEKSSNSDFERKKDTRFIPDKKMFFIFLVICLIVLGFNLSKFPISKFFSMTSLDEGLAIELGWPIQFLLFDLYSVENTSFKGGYFLIDLFVWALFAYILNVLINLILQSKFVKNLLEKKENREAKPKIISIK